MNKVGQGWVRDGLEKCVENEWRKHRKYPLARSDQTRKVVGRIDSDISLSPLGLLYFFPFLCLFFLPLSSSSSFGEEAGGNKSLDNCQPFTSGRQLTTRQPSAYLPTRLSRSQSSYLSILYDDSIYRINIYPSKNI